VEHGTVLVTGASGFAGSHLVEHLAETGASVVGWDRARNDLLNRDAVRTSIRDLRPSAIYHCAGAPHVGQSWAHTADALSSNVLATHYLLDAVRRAGAPCRIVVVGSAFVYAKSDESLSEDAPLLPSSPYALSKLAQEQLGLKAHSEDGMDVLIARSFNHTGPRQAPSFVAPSVARQLALIEAGRLAPVIKVGNIETKRDLMDVRDTVRAYRLLMERGRPGRAYNVCTGAARSIREVIEGLCRRAAVPVELEVDPDRFRPSDTPVLLGSPALLQTETGWAPQVSFDRMLDDLLDYWRAEIAAT
jgi:GDP-4-dehydro-6-deoxy-D-mannose reductase